MQADLQADYPNVKNAHIVPRTYLENFSENGKIGAVLVPEQRKLIQPVSNVGTRRRYYRRDRPKDGTPIDDIEWSLAQGEEAATPVLRAFAEKWPLTLEAMAKLGELFAFQIVRGPRWMDEYSALTADAVEEWGRDQKVTVAGRDLPVTPVELAEAKRLLLTDTPRLIRMMVNGRKLATVLASMHWTLVEFVSPVVATSDHPVVLWPVGAVTGTPTDTAQRRHPPMFRDSPVNRTKSRRLAAASPRSWRRCLPLRTRCCQELA